jgi:hypothetical protein
MSDIPLEDETRSVDEIIAAAKNVINTWSPQFTGDEVLAVAKELDAARAKLTAIAGLTITVDRDYGDEYYEVAEVQAILNGGRTTDE